MLPQRRNNHWIGAGIRIEENETGNKAIERILAHLVK